MSDVVEELDAQPCIFCSLAQAAARQQQQQEQQQQEDGRRGDQQQQPPIDTTHAEELTTTFTVTANNMKESEMKEKSTASSSILVTSTRRPGNSTPIKNRVIYHDALCYAIEDHNPAARLHLLVLPYDHIRSVSELTSSTQHRQLVAHMTQVAKQLLVQYSLPGESTRLGFHVPPCISVPHLHLHVQSGNYRGLKGWSCCTVENCFAPCDCLRMKYTPWCRWFMTVEELQRKIGVSVDTMTSKDVQAPQQEQMT